MKLSEAIKDLQLDLDNPGSVDYEERAEAQALGIEALKRFQEGRPKHFISSVLLLPGETPEDDAT